MKKLFVILLALVITFSMSACRPNGMSAKAYDLGNKALKAGGSASELHKISEQLFELYDAEKMSSPDSTTSTLFVEMLVSSIEYDAKLSDKDSYDKHMAELKKLLGK